ncbi:MAG TPA: alkaline phosphatase D family protein [Methylomirabilota bacterium]|nr:alkaline phosphatase D family protein [Methylomirabilota bacterium]
MSTVSRRRLLTGAGAVGALVLGGALRPRLSRGQARFADYPFKLGVASGDPRPDGFVLWTRLAPDPLAPGGGMGPDPVTVEWEVATDEGMQQVVQHGVATAAPARAHSLHVEVAGLDAERPYWYRFRAGSDASVVGRTRTAPPPAAVSPRLRFAFASCQHWEVGHYAAYHHMQADDLDLVVHLGDYIYEGSWRRTTLRQHGTPEPTDLEGYRRRHALYKTDPALQGAHAAHPWIVTWDDHEVSNDYAADHSQLRDDPAIFRRRRLAAYQAYYEHMPLRPAVRLPAPEMRVYGRLGWGALADFFVLDSRQYRAPQVCGDGLRGGGQVVDGCSARSSPAQTRLGPEQERWLFEGLAASGARWNVLAQQQLMAQLRRRTPWGTDVIWTDGWDGYAGERRRILAHLRDARVANPVVLGGDAHSYWVTDLKVDFTESEPAIATEFVGTSISSAGPPIGTMLRAIAESPHVRYFEGERRGYTRCTVTPERWTTELQALDSVANPRSRIRTHASFVVESGRPGAQRAT